MSTEEQYLTLKEAQVIAKLSSTTLRKKIKSGELKASRPTWKLVIAKSDLDAFLRSCAVSPKVS